MRIRAATFLAVLAFLAAAMPLVGSAQLVDVKFQHKLSSMTGVLPFHGASVQFDPYHKEVLVVSEGRVQIFNPSGMETYSFGGDSEMGSIFAVAALEDGDFLLLTFGDGEPRIVRTNFRGEFKAEITPGGLPASVPRPFRPNALGYAKERIYLADLGGMRLVVLGMDGAFTAFHDLAKLCEVEDRRADTGVKGFRVAPNGDVLFTIQTLFKAYVLSPDGALRSFGVRGSAPGKFNVITGIAVDDKGYYYVADVLKSAVLVFDPNFVWQREFGFRGNKPGSLFAPIDVAAGDGRVYVSQFAKKGVSVFAVTVPETP